MKFNFDRREVQILKSKVYVISDFTIQIGKKKKPASHRKKTIVAIFLHFKNDNKNPIQNLKSKLEDIFK